MRNENDCLLRNFERGDRGMGETMKSIRYEPQGMSGLLSPSAARSLRAPLEALYERLNRPAYLSPDPLELLGAYPDPQDREVVGLVAATLAYGRVAQILKSARVVTEILGPRPARRLDRMGPAELRRRFSGFVHRFTTDEELLALLLGIRRARKGHGSLEKAFTAHLAPDDGTVVPALDGFVEELDCDERSCNSLLARPMRGSACKRLHLFLRWMCRRDEVDPGGWTAISPRQLIVPLDTHMHRMALALGLTDRRGGNGATALQITESFRSIRPDDPVRYDFALTRLGIRRDEKPERFLASLTKGVAA